MRTTRPLTAPQVAICSYKVKVARAGKVAAEVAMPFMASNSSPFSLSDYVFFLAVFLSFKQRSEDWTEFTSCHRPVHIWAVGSQLLAVAFRAGQVVLFTRTATARINNSNYIQEDEQLRLGGPTTTTGASTTSDRADLLRCVLLYILFVLLFEWTVVGNVWIVEVFYNTPTCLPPTCPMLYLVAWLIVCYSWVSVYICIIAIAFSYEYRARRAERFLFVAAATLPIITSSAESAGRHGIVQQYDSLVSRWGRSVSLADYGVVPFVRQGLTPSRVDSLPTVRVLQSCGHIFHKVCIDSWLLRNAICPSCKSLVDGYQSYGTTTTTTSATYNHRNNKHISNVFCRFHVVLLCSTTTAATTTLQLLLV
eukprot:GHVS01068114.1.p1 GENE.GHVS01068114.1~~GHVS01068114.1.p1  ORF type:complete len:365 (-),score=45.12 GHVS01068114.1:67-1161(-)